MLDISQEVLIKLFQSIASFRQGASFTTWHYRIVMNAISSYFRDPYFKLSSAAVNYEDFDDTSPKFLDFDDPQQLLIAEEVMKMLLIAFNRMPKALSTVMRLYEIDGLSYEQIAIKLDCPVGTVRSRIYRARKYIEDLYPL